MNENNTNTGKNNITIPWYQRKVNYNPQEQAAISNIKFNIKIPQPDLKPQEAQNPQEQEQRQPQEQTQKQMQENPRKVPQPWWLPTPIPERNPQGKEIPIPAIEWRTEIKIGESIWNIMTQEEKENFILTAIQASNPGVPIKDLSKGIKFAAKYDYSNFNMGEYYNGLVLECGMALAIIIIIAMGAAGAGALAF